MSSVKCHNCNGELSDTYVCHRCGWYFRAIDLLTHAIGSDSVISASMLQEAYRVNNEETKSLLFSINKHKHNRLKIIGRVTEPNVPSGRHGERIVQLAGPQEHRRFIGSYMKVYVHVVAPVGNKARQMLDEYEVGDIRCFSCYFPFLDDRPMDGELIFNGYDITGTSCGV